MDEKLFVFLEILVISIVCTLLLAIVPLSSHGPQKYYENLVIPMTTKKFVKSTKSLVTYNLHELPLPKPRNDLYDDLGFITLFQLPVKLNQKDVVYHKAEYNQNSINQLKHLIDHQYLASFEFDHLPVIFLSSKRRSERSKFPIGFHRVHSNNNSTTHQNSTYVLFNHMNINIKYYDNKDNEVQIFSVIIDKLESIKRSNSSGLGTRQLEILDFSDMGQKKVSFSYSVHWEATGMNPIKRFNANLNKPSLNDIIYDINRAYDVDRKADHLFHFGVSLGFLFVLSIAVAFTLPYITSTDNDVTNNEDQCKWKLICRDVFRKPKTFELLVSFVGTGVQIVCSLMATVLFGCCNVFAGERYTMIFYIFQWYYLLFGFVGSYCSYKIMRIYMKPPDMQLIYFIPTAAFYPFVMFILWYLGRIIVSCHKIALLFRFDKVFYYNLRPSSFTISLYNTLLFCMAFAWYMGRSFAISTPKIRKPFKGSKYQSPIQSPITWIEKCILAILTGIMTILTLLKCHFLDFVLHYWVEKAFESWFFLMVNFVISLVIFSLANVFLLLYKLNRGDYHWWWLPFENSLAVGIYLFLFAKFVEMQMNALFEIDLATSGLFCLYSLIFSITTALVYGSVGFLVCGVVMHKMYSKLNRDIHYIAVSGGFEDEQPELV